MGVRLSLSFIFSDINNSLFSFLKVKIFQVEEFDGKVTKNENRSFKLFKKFLKALFVT